MTLGAVSVQLVATGLDLPESLRITIGTTTEVDLRPTQSVVVTGLPAGRYALEVGSVPTNCQVDSQGAQLVSVIAADTIDVQVAVACTLNMMDRIVFSSMRDGVWDLYSLRITGAGLINLTTNDAFEGAPAISPAQSTLAFFRAPTILDSPEPTGIYVLSLIGLDDLTSLIPLFLIDGTSPVFAPDDSTVAFQSLTAGEILTVRLDSTRVTNLTNAVGDWAGHPSWSPDGARLAFNRLLNGRDDVCVISAAGVFEGCLTAELDAAAWPAWSPDGSRLAFGGYRDGDQDWEIYVIGVDGTGLRRLTDAPGPDIEPSWSPDGARIAFATERDGNSEIYLMDADGANQTNLTLHVGTDASPAWW